jgi:uncharacterized protein (TIGR03086 family)
MRGPVGHDGDMAAPDGPATNPEAVRTAYQRRAGQLAAVLASVPPDAWDRPSPCAEWTVRDVAAHLVDSQREVVRNVGLELPPGPDAAVDPAGALRDVTDAMTDLLSDPARALLEYDGVFGRTTLAATLETFFVFDMSVHRWDIATGAGLGTEFEADELDAIERTLETVGDSLYEYGACRRIDIPADGDRETRLLARLGRES